MRVLLNKSSSTKAERIFSEILKANRIPFKHRVILDGKEVDFIIGKIAVEIDGHLQKPLKNKWLYELGYQPVHYTNNALLRNRDAVNEDIKHRYGLYCSKRGNSSDGKSI